MHETLKLIIVLGLIATLSGGVLAYVHQAMSPAIEENKLVALGEAILDVLPDAANYRIIPDIADIPVYQGLDENQDPTGIAFVATGSGFGGGIEIMVGLDPNAREIVGIKILDHLETPGLGSRITEPGFTDQFAEKSLDDAYVPKEDIDSITGATISSKAVAQAIKSTITQIEPILRAGGVWQ